MDVWRPCDSVETMIAWGIALQQRHKPSSLVFSRQNLKFIPRDTTAVENIAKGGYVLKSNHAAPEILIIATGSEVELGMAIYDKLIATNKLVQLVSMPSTSVFDQQDASYRNSVLSKAKFKIVLEAGVSDLWYKYVGIDGLILGINTFGESAPALDLFKHFGFTVDQALAKINHYLGVQ
jgi:transketolase